MLQFIGEIILVNSHPQPLPTEVTDHNLILIQEESKTYPDTIASLLVTYGSGIVRNDCVWTRSRSTKPCLTIYEVSFITFRLPSFGIISKLRVAAWLTDWPRNSSRTSRWWRSAPPNSPAAWWPPRLLRCSRLLLLLRRAASLLYLTSPPSLSLDLPLGCFPPSKTKTSSGVGGLESREREGGVHSVDIYRVTSQEWR